MYTLNPQKSFYSKAFIGRIICFLITFSLTEIPGYANASSYQGNGHCFVREMPSMRIAEKLGSCIFHYNQMEDGVETIFLRWANGNGRLKMYKDRNGFVTVNGEPGQEIADDSLMPLSISCYSIIGTNKWICFAGDY